ncbi:MAG: sulfite oxidase [Proteobacteria bacterium]|nr:sulfite oxidase [Pseudomonadota bacterium]MDA1062849.1 sulfite oxidase [Pseudomonadota bacterium]
MKATRQRGATTLSRRWFLRGSGLAAMSAAVGASIPFAHLLPKGLLPIALADSAEQLQLPGKPGLTVFSDRPINAETPAHLLDDPVTPASRLFVRNNGVPPVTYDLDPLDWELSVEGEACTNPRAFTLRELQERFRHYTLQLQLECAGNGRAEFYPATSGNQWGNGAVGCPEWTGVRLKDVLAECGVADNAVYVAYEAADSHLSGDSSKRPISRGVPLHKALESESMLVWAMNGAPLPELHGYPLRMLCAGWPASVSGKWLTRILVRDRVHDGEKMLGQSYRVPCKPVAPGTTVADADMCIIESMPVKSLITFPKSGVQHALADTLQLRGHAWAGDRRVQSVHTSLDFGASWQTAKLKKPVNRLAWQHWTADVSFPEAGYYEVWARAVDEAGASQPVVLPGWNPLGYLNNACHRIAVMVNA